ncbi:hypothetical protein ABK040_014294 [Willaertia magna]
MVKTRERRHKARVDPYPTTATSYIKNTAQLLFRSLVNFTKKLYTKVISSSWFRNINGSDNQHVDNITTTNEILNAASSSNNSVIIGDRRHNNVVSNHSNDVMQLSPRNEQSINPSKEASNVSLININYNFNINVDNNTPIEEIQRQLTYLKMQQSSLNRILESRSNDNQTNIIGHSYQQQLRQLTQQSSSSQQQLSNPVISHNETTTNLNIINNRSNNLNNQQKPTTSTSNNSRSSSINSNNSINRNNVTPLNIFDRRDNNNRINNRSFQQEPEGIKRQLNQRHSVTPERINTTSTSNNTANRIIPPLPLITSSSSSINRSVNINNNYGNNNNNPKPSQQGRKIKNYKEIDHRALNSPKHLEINMTSLVKYLTEIYSTVEEKSRAIFRWITNNISYDYDALKAKNYSLESAKDVFSRRKGMCGGYSNLFLELCKLAGITGYRVVGIAKSSRGDTDKEDEERHAWSAVQTEDKCWHLLDCTWASGHGSGDDNNKKFVKDFEDRYFFIAPKELIYTHLPEQKEWQLLLNPIPKEEFEKIARIRASAFNYGFCALSHKWRDNVLPDCAIETVNVSVDKGCSIDVDVRKKGNPNSKAYENAYHITPKDSGKFEIQLMFPENNTTFEVLIFAKKGDDQTLCTVYHFNISPIATIFCFAFPRKYADYYNYNVTILSKLDGKIITGNVYDFEFKVEGASEVGFMIGDKYTPFKRRDYSNIFYLNYKFEKFSEEKYSTRDLRVCVAIRHSNMYRYKAFLEYKLI